MSDQSESSLSYGYIPVTHEDKQSWLKYFSHDDDDDVRPAFLWHFRTMIVLTAAAEIRCQVDRERSMVCFMHKSMCYESGHQ